MSWIEKRTDSDTYRYCWYENGKKRKKSLKTSKKSIALKLQKIIDAKKELNLIEPEKKDSNIKKLFELYLSYKKNTIAEKSLINYRSSIKNLTTFFEKNLVFNIDKLNSDIIYKYFNFRIENNISNKTISEEFMLLKSLISFSIKNEVIQKDPVNIWPKIKKKAKNPERIGIYSNNEIKKMKEYIKDELPNFYDLFIFLIYTGCRLNEALEFKKKDIDFEKNKIAIRNFKTETNPDNAYRYIEIHQDLCDILLKRSSQNKKHNNLLFPEHLKHSRNWPRREIIKTCKACNIPYKRLHGIRHTWITNLLNAGVPVPQVQYLAGHRKIDTTMRYYKYVNAEVKGKINLIQY